MQFSTRIKGWLGLNQQIGIDLGTAFVQFTFPAQNKSLRQATVVAKNLRSNRIVAIGDEAEKISGRTPDHIKTIHPIVEGVVDDSAALEALLSMLLYRYSSGLFRFTGRRVLVSLPASVTDVDARIISTTLQQAGIRNINAVPAGIAALMGVGAPVGDPTTQLVVNIGAGITQIAAVSGGSVIAESSSTIAGNQFDVMIARYIADEFGVRISHQQARLIKHDLGAVSGWSDSPGESVTVSGQDEASSLPREITVSRIDITEAIAPLIDDLVAYIQNFIGSLSSDMAADIASHGVHLVGGGSRLPGLVDHIAEALNVSVHGRVNPERSIVEGLEYIIGRDDGKKFMQSLDSYESTK